MSFQSWQAANTRIKARPYNDGDTSYVNDNNEDDLILPIDTMEVGVIPYVPEGGTVLELYDNRSTFRPPSFGTTMTLNYAFERTDYFPSAQPTENFEYGTIKDLIGLYLNGFKVDFFVRYEPSGSFFNEHDNPGAFVDYKLVDMIPDITEDTAKTIFEGQARSKPRELEFRSTYVDRPFQDVEWIMN